MSKFNEVLEDKRVVSVEERIKSALDKESYEDFLSAVKNPSISSGAIHRALTKFGIEVSDVSIQRMRRKLS